MILLVSAVFPPEPVVSAYLTYDLALALAKKFSVKVLCPRPSRPEGVNYNHPPQIAGEFNQEYLDSYVYPRSGLLGRMRESYSLGFHAAKYIKRNHTAIEVIYMNVWPLLAEWFITRMAKKKRIPLIHHVQDIYPETLVTHIPLLGRLFVKLLLPLDNYILGNVAKVIVISKSMSNYLLRTRKIGPDKIKIIYNWQDDEPFTKYKAHIIPSQKSVFTFMYLGSLNQTASVHLFVNAIRQSAFNNVRLVVAGDGYEKGRSGRCPGAGLAKKFSPVRAAFQVDCLYVF
jgi:glycosyltransferase involved in cell wall biosynthesis